jgi:hypothetical protein
MLHSADVTENSFRAVGEEIAERRHRGNEDRGSRRLGESEPMGWHAVRAGGKEGGHAEAEHEAGGEHGARPVTLDGTLDGVESRRPEQAREHGQCYDSAPVAAAGQVDDPVGAGDRDEADQDHISKFEYVLARQGAGGQKGYVFGQRKANSTAQQDEE